MRRRRFLVILIGCMVVGIGGWLVWPHPKEPVYKGRTLSEWLDLDGRRFTGELTTDELEGAPEALRHIGTNALPYLLQWIQLRVRPTRTELALQKLPESIRESALFKWLFRRTDELGRAQAAIAGFGMLGPAAKPAIPDLLSVVDSTRNGYAAFALEQLGEDAVQALLEGLRDPGRTNRPVILLVLGQWSNQAQIAVAFPLVIKCLDDADSRVAASAAEALGALRLEQNTVVDALIKKLHHPEVSVRRAVAAALAEWGEAARPAVPGLIRDLKDPRFAREAAETLGELPYEPGPVLRELSRTLQHPDPLVQRAAAWALTNFGEDALPAFPALFEAYTNPDALARREAGLALNSIASGKTRAELSETAMFRCRYGLRYGPPPAPAPEQ